MKRSMLNKDLSKQVEFIVEYRPNPDKHKEQAVPFTITPSSLENVKKRDTVPDFKITGKVESVQCSLTKPFLGELVVEHCKAPIRSIELQLVRVETCGCAEGYAKDATEVQNIQIGEGNICRGFVIPIYMIFPRLFTCPTTSTKSFKIEFEINVVVVFEDTSLVTENFPIKLVRD
eukprot:Opistho-2@24080